MARKPLTNEQRIEIYTELQRRVSVGAYAELEHDGSFPPDDGTPESTTLESLHNLEQWARKQDLQFVWNLSSQTWFLAKIAYGEEPYIDEDAEPPDLVQEMHERIDHDILTHPGEQDEEPESEANNG